jgi:mannitol-1-phosphate 5-dehydrogenase
MREKLVQFGGGNIGRSFIGQLFSRSGYEVVFVDIDESLVAALNQHHQYRLVVKRNNASDEIVWIRNVRAVNGKDRDRVVEEIADATILATSVGKSSLPHILPVLARGLLRRKERQGAVPIDLIIAENIHDGSAYIRQELQSLLPSDYDLTNLLGLVETSIGKMVPIMKQEDLQQDPVWVFAEPYNTLILDKFGFKNPLPKIEGLSPVENIAAYVDRKLFIHNLGHAAAAYLGYRHSPDSTFLYEILAIPEVFQKTRQCMEQSAVALNKAYPKDLTLPALHDHIDDLLERFQNRSLGDTVYRVGRDLSRKLSKDDRLVGAMLLAKKHGCPCDVIAEAVIAACTFRATDEDGNLFPGDVTFAEHEYPQGLEHILTHVCQLSHNDPLEAAVMKEILRKME